MGWLDDSLKFDLFHFKDSLKQLKKDPERLLFGMGTLDPLSTKLTNKVFGKDYEPLTDISGGPYGGHMLSVGQNRDGGVYQRAREAGLDTSARGNVHDAAATIGAAIGGGYLGGVTGLGPTSGGAGASGGGGAGAGGQALNTGAGLLAQPQQPQPAGAPMQAPQQNPQANQMRQIKMMQEMELQALRQKPNKTLEEWQQLQLMTKNQGLLG